MWCAASANELLAARDRRHSLLMEILGGAPATLFLSLNIPGERKGPAGAEKLFAWGAAGLAARLPGLSETHRETDRLGEFALFRCECEPLIAKRVGILLEKSIPAARLLDVDVFDLQGKPIDRSRLGIPPRKCLLCDEAATDCSRLGRHDYRLLTARTDELLRPFRP